MLTFHALVNRGVVISPLLRIELSLAMLALYHEFYVNAYFPTPELSAGIWLTALVSLSLRIQFLVVFLCRVLKCGRAAAAAAVLIAAQ